MPSPTTAPGRPVPLPGPDPGLTGSGISTGVVVPRPAAVPDTSTVPDTCAVPGPSVGPTGSSAPAAALAQLQRLMSELTSGLDLEETLEAVVECVVAGLGFGVGVVSMVVPGGDLVVAAVAGDPEARATLDGMRSTRAEWDRLLGLGQPVGPGRLLRFVDHRNDAAWGDDAMPSWVPVETEVTRRAGDVRPAWHPLDALFAPLRSSTAGLLGVLSVDVPADGLRPGHEQLGHLEMFAVQAAIAVEHARLHTEVLAAQEAARTALAARLQSLVDASPAALVEVDAQGRVREWNRAAERLLGHAAADVLGRPLPRLTRDDRGLPRLLALLQSGASLPTTTVRCLRSDGSELDVELSAAATLGPHGEVQGAMALLVDVTERIRLQRQLQHQATHDALTGLPNRLLMSERLAEALAAQAGCTGVLVLDLDRFKEVNDTLGHHHGDLLLTAVGARLADVLRPGDTLARLAGDEFAVVLPGLADHAAALAVAERLLAAVHTPFDLAGLVVDVEASIGLTVAGSDETDPVALVRQADAAMYEAKELSAGVVSWSAERDGRAPGRLAVLGELRRALEDDELVVHYQPQVEVASGRLCGLEALVRWQHPERGLLAPAHFLPVAETTGLITRLTLRVLDLVLAQVRRWEDAGRAVPVAVNLSARCLHDSSLPDVVAQALARHRVPARLLQLEITESAIMADPDRALAVLREMSDSGVRLSLDDFGTGYSSMAYLRRLPVAELKVDRSFVTDMTGESADPVLVRSVVDLGHNLGLQVVAEGVEDAPTLALLAGLGCDIAQGYLLSRPTDAAGIDAWRRERGC